MKTFIALVLVAVLVWGGWNWISNNQTEVSIEATESPEATMPGLGGEGPEPANYEDLGDVGIGDTSQTSAPVVTTTPAPARRIVTPRPTPTPTPIPGPIIAFRNLDSINGSGETGVIVITANETGNAVINFNMDGFPVGVQQPTHIYRGTSCQASEQLVLSLNPIFNGSGMTITPLKASDLISGQGGPYYLAVHQSTENNTRVSCTLIR